MQYLPYILIMIGSIFILVSFCMKEKEKKNADKRQTITEEEKAGFFAKEKREIDEMFQGKAEDAIEKVDEQLSRISNEKIISVSEYSDQVLEKINQNHQEVVFLYNMLNEKEEEMKKMMTKMKVVSKEDTAEERQKERLEERAGVLTAAEEKTAAAKRFSETIPLENNNQQDNADFEMLQELLYQQEKTDGHPVQEPGKFPENIPQMEENSLPEQVLAMYRNGMSILDISRSLHRGQGEVRLIVELYVKNK